MRIIARSLAAAVLLLAGCAAPHAGGGSAAASALAVASLRHVGKTVVATATAPPEWLKSDALTRGDELAALVSVLRAQNAKGALRIEVTAQGKVVATADSPSRGRVTFSVAK